MLQTATQNRAPADSPLHNIRRFVAAVVGAAYRYHDAGLVSYEHDLAAARVDGGVHDAAEFGGEKTGAVYRYGGVAVGVVRGGFGDVGEDAAFYGYALLDALAEQVGEVDGCVDAYAGEGGACVAASGEFVFGEDAELAKFSSVHELIPFFSTCMAQDLHSVLHL
jgi:hypothetical protein